MANTEAYYRFETGGLLTDSSASGRDLTTNTGNQALVANPSAFPNPVPLTGQANSTSVDILAGNGGLLSAPDDDIWSSSSLTIEAFIEPFATPNGTANVVSHWDSSTNSRSWQLAVLPDGRLRTGLSENGGDNLLVDLFPGAIEGGKSYYVATSFTLGPGSGPSGENVFGTAYLQNLTDGGPLQAWTFTETGGSTVVSALNNPAVPLAIGSTGNETGYFDGKIDEVRISSQKLGVSDLLVFSPGLAVENVPFFSGVLTDASVDGSLESLTVSLGNDSTTYTQADLSGGTLTQFGGRTGNFIADVFTPPRKTVAPASGTRADLLGDALIDTGFVNLSSWAVTFQDDIENQAGPDIVVLDWGGSNNTDTVDITIDGTTLDDEELDGFAIFTEGLLDRVRFQSAGPVTSVAALESAALSAGPTSSSNNNVLAIDLSDFGFADGATLAAGTEVVFSDGSGIDPVAVYGLMAPAPLEGDFNGDGIVNAADYTLYRDNFNGDESVLNNAGDGSGTVDQGDYNLWAANFGSGPTSPSSSAAVPEPTSTSLLAAFVGCGFGFAGRRRSEHRGDA